MSLFPSWPAVNQQEVTLCAPDSAMHPAIGSCASGVSKDRLSL